MKDLMKARPSPAMIVALVRWLTNERSDDERT